MSSSKAVTRSLPKSAAKKLPAKGRKKKVKAPAGRVTAPKKGASAKRASGSARVGTPRDFPVMSARLAAKLTAKMKADGYEKVRDALGVSTATVYRLRKPGERMTLATEKLLRKLVAK